MKYKVEQTIALSYHALEYASGGTIIPSIIVMLAALPYLAGPEDSIFFLAIVAALTLCVTLYLATMFLQPWLLRRAYGDKNQKLMWSYNITPSAITIQVSGKATVTYEKSGVKFCRVYKHGVYFKHARLGFIVFWTDDNKQQALDTLQQHGWLSEKRSPHGPLVQFAIFLVAAIAVGLYIGFTGASV